MREKILLASDSTTDLGRELIDRYQVHILPLQVTLGSQSYADGIDISPDDIYAHYEKTGQLPKTAAVNIADFTDFFAKCTEEGYSVVFFTIGSELSSTYHNAVIAAEPYPNVHVVDTGNLSTGGGLLLLRAGEMREQGLDAGTIAQQCRELAARVDASFVVDNLEFLYKGGRCSALAAFGANLLQLKPSIIVRHGKMSVGKKYRGKFASVLTRYIADQLKDASDIELDHVFVTHAGCDPEICDQCLRQVKELLPFREVHFTRAGCTISSHCGRNTLGVLFIRKTPLP